MDLHYEPDLDFERCYRAVGSRDPRFDGWFYTAVTSTRVYCRPSCPARTPLRHNVRFFRSAAAAHAAGFRPCRRCRPDAVPGSPEWDLRADLVGRAMRLIADGVVDREGVPGLAARVGYTERHLHRLLTQEVGAGPLALARAQRAQSARLLVETTALGLAEIAYAAGFGSLRQFNDTVRRVYGVAPSRLRKASAPAAPPDARVVRLRLPFRAPLSAPALLEFLAARAVAGVELVTDGSYHRGLQLPHGPATVTLTPAAGHVAAGLRLADVRDLAPAMARCRRLLDLDADPVAVDAALAADPALAGAVAAEPGVRVPRAVDGFEMAVRAVVGQQLSVASARTVLARLVSRAGASPAERDGSPAPVPRRLVPFPGPAAILDLPDAAFAMPVRRRETLRALAAAVAAGDLPLHPGADRPEVVARLRALPGIGAWTAGYVAMRALGEPDEFLPTDLGARRGAATLGLPAQPAPLARYAAAHWAPWRSYALIRLWRST